MYRGVGLIRTIGMEIVKKSSELARSSELAQHPCTFTKIPNQKDNSWKSAADRYRNFKVCVESKITKKEKNRIYATSRRWLSRAMFICLVELTVIEIDNRTSATTTMENGTQCNHYKLIALAMRPSLLVKKYFILVVRVIPNPKSGPGQAKRNSRLKQVFSFWGFHLFLFRNILLGFNL